MATAAKRQQGFAIVEVVLILIIVGIIAFVVYRVIQANGTVQTAQNQVPTSTPVQNVPTVNKASDLKTLQNQLNTTQIDDSSMNSLDSATTF